MMVPKVKDFRQDESLEPGEPLEQAPPVKGSALRQDELVGHTVGEGEVVPGGQAEPEQLLDGGDAEAQIQERDATGVKEPRIVDGATQGVREAPAEEHDVVGVLEADGRLVGNEGELEARGGKHVKRRVVNVLLHEHFQVTVGGLVGEVAQVKRGPDGATQHEWNSAGLQDGEDPSVGRPPGQWDFHTFEAEHVWCHTIGRWLDKRDDW